MFIRDYRNTVLELTKLTRKDIPFTWNEEQEVAFQGIKEKICANPVFTIVNPEKQFEVETDALDFGIGRQLG
jgi:hypothetical protein